jgi:hypothetical protein
VEINYFYFLFKLRKPIQLLKNEVFVRILMILNEIEILEKYFLIDLRKAKIKHILND